MSELTDYIGLDRLKVTVLTSRKIGGIIAARARAQAGADAPPAAEVDDANFRDSVAILCAALEQTHPEVSAALIEGLQGTVVELQAAVMAIMDRAGFVAAGEPQPVAISSGNSATSTAPSPPAAAIPRRRSTR